MPREWNDPRKKKVSRIAFKMGSISLILAGILAIFTFGGCVAVPVGPRVYGPPVIVAPAYPPPVYYYPHGYHHYGSWRHYGGWHRRWR